MLRLRAKNGKLLHLNEPLQFVEICDTEGHVARVIYADAQGYIHDVGPGDLEADRYKALFGIKWCPLITLPEIKK